MSPASRTRALFIGIAVAVLTLLFLLILRDAPTPGVPGRPEISNQGASLPPGAGASSAVSAAGDQRERDREKAPLLEVKVCDQAGTTLPGATVRTGRQDATCGADGSCALDASTLTPGMFLEVDCANYPRTTFELGALHFEKGRCQVVLSATASIAGVCVDHEGKPVPDVTVVAHQGSRPQLTADSEIGRALTDANGRFTLDLKAAGETYVTATKDGYVAANKIDDGVMAPLIRANVIGERQLDIRVFPILVSVVGLINQSNLPDDQIANYCAFARDIPDDVGEMLPSMRDFERVARERVAAHGRGFAHLGVWVGRPIAGRPMPKNLPVMVRLIDDTSVIVEPPVVPLAEFSAIHIQGAPMKLDLQTGVIELEVAYPTQVTWKPQGRTTIWQRSVSPEAGRTRLVVPAGTHQIAPSPLALLEERKRRREVEVLPGQTTVVAPAEEPPVAHVRLSVVDANGPIELRSLNLQIDTPRRNISYRELPGTEVSFFCEVGKCRVLVRDGTADLCGRLTFATAAGEMEPVFIPLN